MLKILVVLAFICGVYQIYTKDLFGKAAGPVAKDGKPAVVLAVGGNCGEVCNSVRKLLDGRGVQYEEVTVADANGAPVENDYGIQVYPTTLIGKQTIKGNDLAQIDAVLLDTFGEAILTSAERSAMAGHFDAQGNPKVVLYGTAWCGYCKKQRELFAEKGIPFDDLDVEVSGKAESAYNGLKGQGYPLTYVGYRRFNGYSQDDILQAVDELVKK
jgi:glutaredoxin